ncbi:MAG TPA: hypothetical protein VEL76_41845 [Gemmataceae bacterium]|nr:hypothetical protein [Gemmataceae bacterium]
MRCRNKVARWLLALGVVGTVLWASGGSMAGEKKNPAATPSPRIG